MQEDRIGISEMDHPLEHEDETPLSLGEAQVVIQIARWRSKETLKELEHESRILQAADWVQIKVLVLVGASMMRLENHPLKNAEDLIDKIITESLYRYPGPLRNRFRSPQIDSLIRAANFHLSLYDTNDLPHTGP